MTASTPPTARPGLGLCHSTELDRVDDRGNKLEPNIPDTWRTTALRGEYPDCLAQSVAQVFRSMCGPLAMSGSREDRAAQR